MNIHIPVWLLWAIGVYYTLGFIIVVRDTAEMIAEVFWQLVAVFLFSWIALPVTIYDLWERKP